MASALPKLGRRLRRAWIPLLLALGLSCLAGFSRSTRLPPAFVGASRAPSSTPRARGLLTKRHGIPVKLPGSLPNWSEHESRMHWAEQKLKRKKLFFKGGITREKSNYSPFAELSGHRGTSRRGKQNHFHLLDRYIRRIDALVPPDMEHLVLPLHPQRDQWKKEKTIKIIFPNATAEHVVTEEDVLSFLDPIKPKRVVTGWERYGNQASPVFVHFATNEDCRAAKLLSGEEMKGEVTKVSVSWDRKFRIVLENMGLPPLDEEDGQEAGPPPLDEEDGQEAGPPMDAEVGQEAR